jgi:hypothetical protein
MLFFSHSYKISSLGLGLEILKPCYKLQKNSLFKMLPAVVGVHTHFCFIEVLGTRSSERAITGISGCGIEFVKYFTAECVCFVCVTFRFQ